MQWKPWMTTALEILAGTSPYLFALMAGAVAGIAWGWIAGMATAAGLSALIYAVGCAAEALARKAFETKVPQRNLSGKDRQR